MTGVTSKVNLNDGYHFYKHVLKSPKFVLAPMVAQSELAWRMLARKHGSQLCYTPMCSANTFLLDKNYQKQVTVVCIYCYFVLYQWNSLESLWRFCQFTLYLFLLFLEEILSFVFKFGTIPNF